MTLQLATAKVRKSGAWVPAVGGSSTPWTRPSGWLALPTIGAGEQKFVGLFQVTNDDGNYVAFNASGDYTVDWGDGNTENIASGVNAEHLYAYADVGGEITVNGITYRQAIVVVTPQAGHDLTSLDFQQIHSALSFMTTPSNTAWLQWLVSSSALTTFVENNEPNGDGLTIFGPLESVEFQENALTNLDYAFAEYAGVYITAPSLARAKYADLLALTSAVYWHGSSGNALVEFSCGNVPLLAVADNWLKYAQTLQSFACGNAPLLASADNWLQYAGAVKTFICGVLSSLANADNWLQYAFSLLVFACADLSALVSAISWLSYAQSLRIFICGDLSSLTSADYWMSYCVALEIFACGNVSALASAASFMAACASVRSFAASGIVMSFSLAGGKLNRAALVAVFNALGTAVAQTITITGNYGSASLSAGDLLIATAKGWTVTQ